MHRWIFCIVSPVFSVTQTFLNHSNMLICCSRNIYFIIIIIIIMLKTVVLLNIYVEANFFLGFFNRVES